MQVLLKGRQINIGGFYFHFHASANSCGDVVLYGLYTIGTGIGVWGIIIL